jgi:subtilisin family serine protease
MRGDHRPFARRRLLWPLLGLLACALATAATAAPAADTTGSAVSPDARMIVVAITDKADLLPGAGATPRGYSGLPDYSGSARSRAAAKRIANDYSLREVSAWTIDALHLRCMLYELPADIDRDAALTRLRADHRVNLAQALQEFETYASPSPSPVVSRAAPGDHAGYNDPYVGLQQGFSSIDAASAQRWASGSRIEIAVVDTGLDATHPDLAGRIASQRDFATAATEPPERDRHGTEVAGVIAAVANNGVGIVGIAPGTRLRSFRACWPVSADSSAARCNTFTLAQALGAAISSGSRVINLSLGGPSDPLLEQLVSKAIQRGIIVVGAVPPDSRMDGFPIDVDGVIAVRSSDSPASSRPSLAAPGRDILTLEPGGHYDYASGSSLATAHVTGTVALLLELDPRLVPASLFALLSASSGNAGPSIDACAAIRSLTQKGVACNEAIASRESRHADH